MCPSPPHSPHIHTHTANPRPKVTFGHCIVSILIAGLSDFMVFGPSLNAETLPKKFDIGGMCCSRVFAVLSQSRLCKPFYDCVLLQVQNANSLHSIRWLTVILRVEKATRISVIMKICGSVTGNWKWKEPKKNSPFWHNMQFTLDLLIFWKFQQDSVEKSSFA